jgi:ABC-type nitrate/sulfonate/bicarbonate transport system ATPase subunit
VDQPEDRCADDKRDDEANGSREGFPALHERAWLLLHLGTHVTYAVAVETYPAVLELAGIEHAFPGTGPVLAGIDLVVREGEVVALVGPSGCGKSTLLAVAAGVLTPEGGRVLAAGRDVTGRAGAVALMLQRDLLLEWRSVLGNVMLAPELAGRARAAAADARALLARHGLEAFAEHYPHALSGGMRQRVALVRTLLAERPVLALDEPLAALDAQARLDAQGWLEGALGERGGAALLVTHDVDEAVRLADRVVVLSARPARVVSVVDVSLPRARDEETMLSAPFLELRGAVFRAVRAEVHRAAPA